MQVGGGGGGDIVRTSSRCGGDVVRSSCQEMSVKVCGYLWCGECRCG